MDVIHLIRNDHGELREQLGCLARVAVTNPEDSVALFYSIRQNLSAHHQAEEQLLFSRLRGFDECRDVIDCAWEEHAAIELYVQRMHRSHKMVRWAAKTELLRELAERHMWMEERAVFDVIAMRLVEELDTLGDRFDLESHKLLALLPI